MLALTDFALHGDDHLQERMRHALERMTDYRRIKLDRIAGENRDFREFRSVTLVPELTFAGGIANRLNGSTASSVNVILLAQWW